MLIRDIGLKFSFLVMSLSAFGIRDIGFLLNVMKKVNVNL